MAYNLNDVALLKHVNTLAVLVKDKLDATIKYVSTSDIPSISSQPLTTPAIAAFSFNFPEEIFLDQVGTTLAENFSRFALSCHNSTNPNLNGKTVLVLAVKGDATTPTVKYSFVDTPIVKYSFVDLSKLIDTYAAADNFIVIKQALRCRQVKTTTLHRA